MLSLLQLIDTAASQAADKVVLDWWMTLVSLLLFSTLLYPEAAVLLKFAQ